jgi:hypothetical protein
VPDRVEGEFPIRWSADGRFLYTALPMDERRHCRITRVELSTGARTPWADLDPSEGGGVRRVGNPMVSADGGTLVYTYGSLNADLYWVEGLK